MRFMHKATRQPVMAGDKVLCPVTQYTYDVLSEECGDYGLTPELTMKQGGAVDYMTLTTPEEWEPLGIVHIDVAFYQLYLVGHYDPTTKGYNYEIETWHSSTDDNFLAHKFWVAEEPHKGFDPYKAQLERFDEMEDQQMEFHTRTMQDLEDKRRSMQALEYHPTMEKV